MTARLKRDLARAKAAARFRGRRVATDVATRVRARIGAAKGQPRVLVLGDSHARVFRQPSFRTLPFRFDVESIMGATVSGIENPNSQTQAGPIFERRLVEAESGRDRPAAVIVMLGEVDCGFVIWWLHQQEGHSVEAGVDRAIENLARFAKRAAAVAPLFVVSAQLPTIRDNAAFPEYAGVRRRIKASQVERTALVREFNRRARPRVEAIGATYLDLDDASLGPDGLVSPLLVKPFATDHHYDGAVYAQLLQRSLIASPPFRA